MVALADERDVLVTLVESYENKHYNFGPADPMLECSRRSGDDPNLPSPC